MVLISEVSNAGGWTGALGLGPREHVAIVGAGGKTSLCFALANELSEAGSRVITTTTTKMWYSEVEAAPCLILSPSGSAAFSRVKAGLREKGHVFVAQRLLESGKVEGIGPETADAFFHDPYVDFVIAEADGAAGRPVKVPAPHEPVIPHSVSLVIAVMGLEALGTRLDPQAVFRPELFRDITGLDKGGRLTPEALATVIQSPAGLFKGTPACARRIVLLNKSDRLRFGQDADGLAHRLLQSTGVPIERVVVGSLKKGTCRIWMREADGVGGSP